MVTKYTTHSRTVLRLAARFGWHPGARYTNLRDVRDFDRLGFLDIDWRNYNFARHLEACRATRPELTVACDLLRRNQLARVLDQAHELLQWADQVIVVPKARSLAEDMEALIPSYFRFGYSVPTRYGGTRIPTSYFQRPVHLLGGRPDVQRRVANELSVVSLDCNRFTLDAAFGDYFDGETFRPHPIGGYKRCLSASLRYMTKLWQHYAPAVHHSINRRVA